MHLWKDKLWFTLEYVFTVTDIEQMYSEHH